MNDQRDLEGLSALVTGATSGIGRAAAEELSRHGAEITVHGRDADRGSAVAHAITAAGGKARFMAADLTDPAQVEHLAEQAGLVDMLVNNAGFSWFGPTAELDVATIAAGPDLTSGAAPDHIEALGATTLLARPGEIASVIAFLAFPKASCISGAVIAADGGRTAI